MKIYETDEIKSKVYDKRRKEYEEDQKKPRSGKWNASALGTCRRKQFLRRMGATVTNQPTIEGLGKMLMGRLHEESVLKEIKKAGIEITDLVDGKQVEVGDDFVVGRLDGIIEEIPLEIKSQQSMSFWHRRKKEKQSGNTGPTLSKSHLFQILYYMMKREQHKGRFLYVSKDDSTMLEITVEATDEDFNLVKDRITELQSFWTREIIPQAVPEEDWECSNKWCNYYTLCKLLGKEECPKAKVEAAEKEYQQIKQEEK